MASIIIPRIILSGVDNQSYTAEIAFALIDFFKTKQASVSVCLYGSDLQFAKKIQRRLSRTVRCIDPRQLNFEQVLDELLKSSIGAELLLIISPYSFFDSPESNEFEGSVAELSIRTATPVILTCNAEAYGSGSVPALKGFQDFASGLMLAGVFLVGNSGTNCLRVKYNEFELIHLIEKYLDTDFIEHFSLKFLDLLNIPRGVSHWQNKSLTDHQTLKRVQEYIFPKFNKLKIRDSALRAKSVNFIALHENPAKRRTRIAVAQDLAFCLHYQNNTALLSHFGAELVPFTPLTSKSIPDNIGAIYLPGIIYDGYLIELSKNVAMADCIRSFVNQGGVLYAEGSSLTICAAEFNTPTDRNYRKGWALAPIKANSIQIEDKKKFGMVQLLEDCILGEKDQEISYHAEHDYTYAPIDKCPICFKNKFENDRYIRSYSTSPQSIFTNAYLNFASNPEVAINLVENAEVVYSLEEK